MGNNLSKSPTGITGFDEIAMGGLPTGRTSLLTGGPGSGKTVFALQAMTYWASERGEPGIFVAFEQDPATLQSDASTFDWDWRKPTDDVLTFIDARPNFDLVTAGAFDISGMLALLQTQVEAIGAKAICLDGIDILLAQMGDPELIRRELFRLQRWLDRLELTALITCKDTISDPRFVGLPSLDLLQYMVACSIMLSNDVIDDVLQRTLRIEKYRGSDFLGNAVPFLIGAGGIDVPIANAERTHPRKIAPERILSGISGIDAMLRGGYFQATCALLTGLPGTGKTLLSGAFLSAACARGERTLLVSFISDQEEIVRNFMSVSIDLEPFIDSGQLLLLSTRASIGSGESHLRSISTVAQEHDASCIVIDPISALISFFNRRTSPGLTERLIDWAKNDERTLLCTALLGNPDELVEPPLLHISTLADTWIHLENSLHGGERRRALSVLKSRGTGHSSQLREMSISDDGIALADGPPKGGEHLRSLGSRSDDV